MATTHRLSTDHTSLRPDEPGRPANPPQLTLHEVRSTAQRAAALDLVSEYLHWVADVARTRHGLVFDVEAMLRSDLDDPSKFSPPNGRLIVVQAGDAHVGVGALQRCSADIGEIQRLYVQPHLRGVGAGRLLLQRLLREARQMGLHTLRLESLKALAAAHALYRAVGFVEIDPYADNSMQRYQAADALAAYRASAVFMELRLRP